MHILHMIMSFPKQQLSLHALLWTMRTIPYLSGLDKLWQYLLRFENQFSWKKYQFTTTCGGGKRWETCFYMCVNPPSKTIVVMVTRKVLKAIACSFSQTLKQMDTQITNGMSTLKMWKMCNCKMWQAKVDM